MNRILFLALGVAFALVAVLVAFLGRRRRVLAGGGLLVALFASMPLVYQGLVHLGALRETYLRFYHPWWLLLVAAAGLFVGVRLSALPRRMGTTRRALVTALSAIAVLASCLAVAEPELGRPLDRMTVILALDRSRSIDLVPGVDKRLSSELRVAELGMRKDDRVGTVVFASEAVTEDPPRPKSDVPPAQRGPMGIRAMCRSRLWGRGVSPISPGQRRFTSPTPPRLLRSSKQHRSSWTQYIHRWRAPLCLRPGERCTPGRAR